jgi:3-hydroxyisobutyrate dehydrogenase-like beta-hydroxyacid dehydrogenase
MTTHKSAIITVGLIGAGLMGHGIGSNIVTKGFKLNVMGHKNRAPIDDLVSKGAHELKTPAEIASHSDMVILCVTGTPQVEELIYSKHNLLDGARAGLIIADCSTAIPDSTIKLAAYCAEKSVHFIDTPMTRTPKEAAAGKLGLMVGGEKATIDHVRPVLDCFADMIVHCGGVGTGHQVKLINNFLSLGHAAMAAEAITVAKKAGIDMESFRQIIMNGGAQSTMFGRLINVPLHDDDSHAMFAIRNARKDLRYYTNMTETMPVATPLADTVHQLLTLADNQGYGERYVPRLIDVFSKLNGVK